MTRDEVNEIIARHARDLNEELGGGADVGFVLAIFTTTDDDRTRVQVGTDYADVAMPQVMDLLSRTVIKGRKIGVNPVTLQ